jgi:hypothetical protein
MKKRTLAVPLAVLLSLSMSCAPGGSAEETAAVLDHHLDAVKAGNIEEIMADYSTDAVLYTPNGPLRGHKEIREFFTGLPDHLPPTFWDEFSMIRQDAEGETAYIVWTAGDIAPLGTDTFIIRNRKIVVQTFAAHMPPAQE